MSTVRNFDVSVYAGSRALVDVQQYPVYENEITFLFGESGIGKSVISKALYGYHSTPDLAITINNEPYARHLHHNWTKEVYRNSFFVFQEPSSHLNPLLKIREQLSEGSLSGCDDTAIIEQLWSAPSATVNKTILDIFPKAFRPSGGEKQRILLAMAFKRIDAWIHQMPRVNEATMFVFDEPTGSLDNNYRNLFLQMLFERYSVRPFTATIITHDYSIISEVFKHYKHLTGNIHFNELSRRGESTVAVSSFSPHEYLSWLSAPKSRSYAHNESAPVVTVKPHFSIFGRALTIYADKDFTTAVPLVIHRGDMVYLKAPSGIGKTTLAKIIMGIYHPQQFSMNLDGYDITEASPPSLWQKKIWGKCAGMVFQHADESLNLASTMRETFKGLPIKQQLSVDALISYLTELFDKSTIPALINKKVSYLSGGQKQRLNLLRTLILETSLTILDEPLNGLDFTSVKKVLTLLDEKRARGNALLMISHNEEIFDHFIEEKNIYYLNVGRDERAMQQQTG